MCERDRERELCITLYNKNFFNQKKLEEVVKSVSEGNRLQNQIDIQIRSHDVKENKQKSNKNCQELITTIPKGITV